MGREFKEDRRKFKELLLYVSQQCASDPEFGSTLLNKILFFADFLAYARLGTPITGAVYVRDKRGPIPRGIEEYRKELRDAGDLRITSTELRTPKGFVRRTPVALRDPDMSQFSEDEIALVQEVVESFRGWPAGKISKYTHEFANWRAARLYGAIPYETIFIGPDQRLTEAEIRRGQELARRLGWPSERS